MAPWSSDSLNDEKTEANMKELRQCMSNIKVSSRNNPFELIGTTSFMMIRWFYFTSLIANIFKMEIISRPGRNRMSLIMF